MKPDAVWIAYYADWSSFGVFETEVEALRYAVENAMQVRQIVMPCGSVPDTIREHDEEVPA